MPAPLSDVIEPWQDRLMLTPSSAVPVVTTANSSARTVILPFWEYRPFPPALTVSALVFRIMSPAARSASPFASIRRGAAQLKLFTTTASPFGLFTVSFPPPSTVRAYSLRMALSVLSVSIFSTASAGNVISWLSLRELARYVIPPSGQSASAGSPGTDSASAISGTGSVTAGRAPESAAMISGSSMTAS